MLRDNLVGLIEPMQISAGVDPLALTIRKQASDDRPSCLENPRPERAETSLTENVTSPFQAEPAQLLLSQLYRCSETYSQKGKDKKTIERDGFRWIAKTHAEFQNETGLTRKQQLRASALLRRLGIMETRVMHFNGIPMNHWRLNLEKLNVLLGFLKRDT